MVGKKGDATCEQKISLWCLQLLLGLRDRLGDRIQRCLGRWIVRDSAWALGTAPSYPGKQRGPHGPCSELLSFMELTDVDLGLRVPYWDSSSKTGLCTHLSWLSIFKPKGQSVSEVAQSCPTLCNPTDCSLPGSSIHGIFQVRVLEWGQGVPSSSPYWFLIPCKSPKSFSISVNSITMLSYSGH